MKCPRCSLFDIPDGAPACAVCGYQLPGANAEPASPPPSPSSPGPPAPALTELDARRELAREFRIEALLSEEHTSELQSQSNLVCRLLLEKKKKKYHTTLTLQARSSRPFVVHHRLHSSPTR